MGSIESSDVVVSGEVMHVGVDFGDSESVARAEGAVREFLGLSDDVTLSEALGNDQLHVSLSAGTLTVERL